MSTDPTPDSTADPASDSAAGTGADTAADLDALSTDELRARAFRKAERTHDVAFVWDVAKHMRGSRAIAGEDGSSGAITGSVAEAVHVVREMLGKEPFGEDEPLLRARFLDYLKD